MVTDFSSQSVKIREIRGKVLGKRQSQAMSCSPIWAKFRCQVFSEIAQGVDEQFASFP
jgi:hypothetical protein